MTPTMIGVVGFAMVLVLMLMRMPIGVCFLSVGFLGIAYMSGIDIAVSAVCRVPYTWSTEYVFTCIPLFVLMGFVSANSGITKDFYDSAYKFLGRLPGGLAVATLVGCGGFASISGSSTASAATMSSICYPEMKRYKYSDALATGAIAAGGTLGIMIPPSLGFVIFGILSNESIGKLFIAGVIPGIIELLAFIAVAIIWVKIKPKSAPVILESFTWKEKLRSLSGIWPILLIFIFLITGIYTGIFTAMEGGGMGAFSVIILTFLMKRMTIKKLIESLKHTAHVTAMMFLLLMGAMVFNIFLALTNLPQTLSVLLTSIGSPTLMVAILLLMYLPLGCFMDATAMFILTIPLFLDALIANNINLIWFGVLTVIMAEIALLTPPVGMNVFVVQGSVREVNVETIFAGSFPFVLALLLVAVIVFFMPVLALYLPSLMKV